MPKEDIIDKTFDHIIQKGFDVNTSSLQDKVVVLVTTAQGIIDNGGFQYFFENEFEGDPNLQDFVSVFEQIGALESAGAIKKAIEINASNEHGEFDALDAIMFKESESNYNKLREYIRHVSV